MKQLSYAALIGVMLWVGTAWAVPTPPPQQKCEAGKNYAAGKYAACRQTAEKKLVLTGDATRYTTAIAECDTLLSMKWQRLEAAATAKGTTCPSTGDEAAVQTFLTANADAVATALHTPPLPTDVLSCNSQLSSCTSELTACYAASCPSAWCLSTGQTTSYGPGSDGDLQKGVVRQYVDNGDGTITDLKTGLMWEKKDQSGGIHDSSHGYNVGHDVTAVHDERDDDDDVPGDAQHRALFRGGTATGGFPM